ncbi:MAG: RDD family protein, partial [Bacteroidia bacterium]
METIKINTTQNVSLSYSAAGIGPRILAGLLDAVFIFAYTCIIFLIFSFAIRRETYSDDYE